ncbi:hypothetical protein O9K51_00713 [Purpureocillium lavendulum]|uniref:Uncharacterized protein n=1 Tax=Purpureocillium lavendulum TaxID=1247861 RepID=A0AB34G2N1_9HYPO|nr:hypothetical protein O9K51_00713 [Purpureocillium lavendulum]
MAPLTSEPEAPAGDPRSPTPIAHRPWVILAIVFGALCVVGIVATLLHRWYKKSRPYREVGEEHDAKPAMATITIPSSTWPKPSPSLSISSIHSNGDEDHEMQRAQIIRKSLASRASSRDMTRPSCETLRPLQERGEDRQQGIQVETQQTLEKYRMGGERSVEVDDDTPVESPMGVVRDWKQWEAGVRQDRSRSLAYHPSMDDAPENEANASTARSLANPAAHRPLTYPAGMTDLSSLASPFGGRQHPMYSPLSPVGETENEYTHV